MREVVVSQILKRAFTISGLGVLYSSNLRGDKYPDNEWLKVDNIHESNIVEIESIAHELVDMDCNKHKPCSVNEIMHSQINFILD